MIQGLDELAWSIVTGLNNELVSASQYNILEKTEGVRLAGLSFVLSEIGVLQDIKLSKLSYEAERLGVDFKIVSPLTRTILDSFRGPKLDSLDTPQIVYLLGLIHAIGSYHLPRHYNHGTQQKPLGAYYTPQRVADYIVSLTLSPVLDRLAREVSKQDSSALEEILSLRVLDPACGTGVFLVSAMKAISDSLKKGISLAHESGVSHESIKASAVSEFLGRIRNQLFGVDVDFGALEVTDVSLQILSGEIGISFLGKNLKQGNSLISLNGLTSNRSYNHYFSNARSRLPFNWANEFRDVMNAGGFDFVIMNPPYERLKPNLAEFLRERILTGDREVQLDAFNAYKEYLQEDLTYFRKSGEYQFGNRFSIDVYRLFIERALQLTCDGGGIGFIVPSTILGDLSSYPLRKYLLSENRIQTVTDFVETSGIFDGVTQAVSVLSLQKGGMTSSFQAQFKLRDTNDISSHKQVRIQVNRIENIMGPYFTIPQVGRQGWSLLDKIHTHPPISSIGWLNVKRGELDLTLNRSCIVSETTEYRLIRGSNISRYSLLLTSKPEWVDISKLRDEIGQSSRINHISKPRIACQQVSNRTQRWRLKFSNIPPDVILANSCNYMILNQDVPKNRLLFLLGVMNSELMNWRFELSNTNNHVSIREISQLPLPIMDRIPKASFESITKEVKARKRNGGRDNSVIEAKVFDLFDFSADEARSVLEWRRTPDDEKLDILRILRTG